MNQIELAKEIDELYQSIKKPITRDPHGLMDELSYRCEWLARSAEIEADAQYHLDRRRGEVCDLFDEENWNSLKIKIESETAQERKLLALADRLNATLTHQIDAIRSILSFEKQSRANQ